VSAPKHVLYTMPVGDRKRTAYAAALVAVAALLIAVWWPRPSHAVTRPDPKPAHSQATTTTVTVTVTGDSTICVYPSAAASPLPKVTSKQRPRS
jgi:hypothetical protein